MTVIIISAPISPAVFTGSRPPSAALANGSPCRARPAKTASSPAPPHAAACARAGRDKKTLPPLKVQSKRGGAVPCKGPTPSTSARFGRNHAQTQRLDRGGRRWGEQQYPVELAPFAVEPKGGRHRAHRRERFVGGAFADLFLQFRQFGFPVVGRTVEQEVHRELAL